MEDGRQFIRLAYKQVNPCITIAWLPPRDPAEQRRLAQLLIERVVLGDDGLEIVWRDLGWQELAASVLSGTIGAELQELEAEAV